MINTTEIKTEIVKREREREREGEEKKELGSTKSFVFPPKNRANELFVGK